MLKLINKNYSQYHVLKKNLKLCAAVPSNWSKPGPKFDVTGAKFEFEFPEDLDALNNKEGMR